MSDFNHAEHLSKSQKFSREIQKLRWQRLAKEALENTQPPVTQSPVTPNQNEFSDLNSIVDFQLCQLSSPKSSSSSLPSSSFNKQTQNLLKEEERLKAERLEERLKLKKLDEERLEKERLEQERLKEINNRVDQQLKHDVDLLIQKMKQNK